jgi:protein-tyrosine phosphatase
LLLHTEDPDGNVVPVWEDVRRPDVAVLREIMEHRKNQYGVELLYERIPITAERSPDFSDLSELISVMLRKSSDTPIVLNCQLGRGRSTLASVSAVVLTV